MSDTYRASFRGAFRDKPVVIDRTGPEFVFRDADTFEEIDRSSKATTKLTLMPAGKWFLNTDKGKAYVVDDDDVAIARLDFAEDASSGPAEDPFELPLHTEHRWQYLVLNVGAFNSEERMQAVLAKAGAAGWELATVMDKASNWLQGMEKGFLLLKRAVPEGVTPKQWCFTIRG